MVLSGRSLVASWREEQTQSEPADWGEVLTASRGHFGFALGREPTITREARCCERP